VRRGYDVGRNSKPDMQVPMTRRFVLQAASNVVFPGGDGRREEDCGRCRGSFCSLVLKGFTELGAVGRRCAVDASKENRCRVLGNSPTSDSRINIISERSH